MVYAFNSSNVQSWPIAGFTTHWFGVAFHDQEVRDALVLSLKAGLLASAIAMLLGSVAAFAIHRFKFFGRETISFVFVLPIALPGIITGMALNSFFVTGGLEPLDLDDRDRARDLLRGDRLQQPARPAAADVALAARGVDRTSVPTAGRRSGS